MRYQKIPTYYVEDKKLWFAEMYINPFQIESFFETEINFLADTGESTTRDTVKVRTKSGDDINVDLPMEEFLQWIDQ